MEYLSDSDIMLQYFINYSPLKSGDLISNSFNSQQTEIFFSQNLTLSVFNNVLTQGSRKMLLLNTK